ncbi:GntR family transcriptional regulator, partial [Nitratifractor sp.]
MNPFPLKWIRYDSAYLTFAKEPNSEKKRGTVVILKLQEGNGTLTERLYLTLKEWILHEAKPGTRLPSIRTLAAENRISRTTV